MSFEEDFRRSTPEITKDPPHPAIAFIDRHFIRFVTCVLGLVVLIVFVNGVVAPWRLNKINEKLREQRFMIEMRKNESELMNDAMTRKLYRTVYPSIGTGSFSYPMHSHDYYGSRRKK